MSGRLATPADQVQQRLADLEAHAQELEVEIHNAALEILAHTAEHFDVRGVQKFMELPVCERRQAALRAWFTQFGPLVWNGEDELKQIPRTNLRYRPYNLEAARKTCPFELST